MQLDKLKVISVDEIDSTNKYLINNYKHLPNHTLIKTNYQTEGKGQFERRWHSNKNENLLFSLLIKDVAIINIDYIKKHTIDSLLKLLELYDIKGIFKEPNDILINAKKILGILIETNTKNHYYYNYIVIGIGLNINQTIFDNLEATSFKLINEKEYNIGEVFSKFINIFYRNLKLT